MLFTLEVQYFRGLIFYLHFMLADYDNYIKRTLQWLGSLLSRNTHMLLVVMSAPYGGPTYCFRDGLCTCAKFWNRLCVGIFWPIGGQVPPHRPLWVRYGHLWNWVVFSSHCRCMHQIFRRFLRHIGTFIDHLGGSDTPVGRVQAPKTGQSWANTWDKVEVSISASNRAPYTIFLEVPETHRNILAHLGGVDTPFCRVPVSKNQAKLQIMGEWEVNISASIRAPCTNFLEVPETHRNISTSLTGCWHPHG